MMEIIPNWHPIFVHFTVGLLGISALFYLAGYALKKPKLLLVGRWNLWIGALITVGTVIAGFDAYNTVVHDAPSHAAMTDHKQWAIVTSTLFGLLALWSFWKHRGAQTVHVAFVLTLSMAGILLGITGFKGGEVVYRHGTGVMRMIEVVGDGGHDSHSHGGEDAHGMEMPMDTDMHMDTDTGAHMDAEEDLNPAEDGHGNHTH